MLCVMGLCSLCHCKKKSISHTLKVLYNKNIHFSHEPINKSRKEKHSPKLHWTSDLNSVVVG